MRRVVRHKGLQMLESGAQANYCQNSVGRAASVRVEGIVGAMGLGKCLSTWVKGSF